MITKELINFCIEKTKIEQRDLIEKDLILHFILLKLSKDKDFLEKYAFKGGTCLIRCYLGYFRFSEDLDFTYLMQEKFRNKSNSQARKIISAELQSLISLLAGISSELGLNFKPDKTNKDYFEFGDGNRFTTIKIWYKSTETGLDSFVKIQINFIEHLEYEVKRRKANNLIFNKAQDFLLPPGSEWAFQTPIIKCYGIKEILCEKIRAVLTRRGVKPRDFIDIYMIEKAEKTISEKLEKKIIRKTRSALDNAKYLRNLENKKKTTPEYAENQEARLMLTKLDRDFYNSFLKRFNIFLKRLLTKI